MNKRNLSNEQAHEQRQAQRKNHWGDNPKVRCLGGFADGNLKIFFDELDQDYVIAHNEVRTIPAALLERCINSGGKFERVLE